MPNADEIASELDAMHRRAKLALEQKDLAAYGDLFAPELAYCQPNGRVIGRDQLMRDVATQFRRLSWVSSSFVRESIEPGDDRAIELLVQTGFALATAFFFIHRIWKLDRRGRYYWKKVGGRWQIDRAEVIEERVSGSLHFGLPSSIERR